jgi:anti-anti-sigma regulatory factor
MTDSGPLRLPAPSRTESVAGRPGEQIDTLRWTTGQRGPAFSEVVDQRHRTIRAGGDLTVQGADLVRGTVLLLQGNHRGRVTLDRHGVRTADDAGLQDLENLRQAVTENGGELVLLHVPAPGAVTAPPGQGSSGPAVHPG